MNFSIDSLKTPEQEITGCYLECHGPSGHRNEEIHDWVLRMINMLGLDDCKFLMRNRERHLHDLWMSRGTHLFVRNIAHADRYDWGEVAVKITNNPKLEAVRIISQHEALDSRGFSYRLSPPIIEGPPPMPDYQGRWGLDYYSSDQTGGSITAQNGEQQPGPTDE